MTPEIYFDILASSARNIIFAIVATVTLGGLHADRIEPFLDSARGFVGGQNAFARRDEGLSNSC